MVSQQEWSEIVEMAKLEGKLAFLRPWCLPSLISTIALIHPLILIQL